jgi:hypothetical protein
VTAAVALAVPAGDRVGWHHVRQLAMIEARRYATRASIWIGWAATVLMAARAHPDWAGGSYESVVPLSFSMMILGVYIAGARTGRLDIDTDLPPLAEEAAMDRDDRRAARLLGLAMPVGLAVATTIGIALVSRLEGGFWLGEGPRRTDTALHTPLELAQPALAVALAGALGVVTGSTFRRPLIAILAGAFAWFVLFPAYWIWNTPPLNAVVPLQTMPLHVDLPSVAAIRQVPLDWYVEYPNQYEAHFTRDLVDIPTVLYHNVFLLGMIMVVGAAVGRSHSAVVRLAGIVVAVVGVVAQLAVSPFGWTG